MAYMGILKGKGICAICKKSMVKGSRVFFDSKKRQGFHLVHEKCWKDLVESRGGPSLDNKRHTAAPAREDLDPPF